MQMVMHANGFLFVYCCCHFAHVFMVQLAEYLDLTEGANAAEQRLVDTRNLLQRGPVPSARVDHRPAERDTRNHDS